MILPIDDILPLIPQKPPFVMVSGLVYVAENSARSSFLVNADNVFVKDNLFQEAGLLENMAQTAALGAGYVAKAANKPVLIGYIGAIKDLEIFSLPKVNDELITGITIENRILNVTVISGKVWHNDYLLARCEMKLFTRSE
ncbi:MAG TPA: 3-hydroxyacyl-ACP dehydratase [Mucilaginibacter sp.]